MPQLWLSNPAYAGLWAAVVVALPPVSGLLAAVGASALFVLAAGMVEDFAQNTPVRLRLAAARPIDRDAAPFLPDLSFPEACPAAMLAGRTFWEKATFMHIFCLQQRGRGDRLSRHWHGVVRLDDAGIVDKALSDHAHALAIARHKTAFFKEKNADGAWVDYETVVSGGIRLVPTGSALDALDNDYAGMLANGSLLDDGESFEALIGRCAEIETRANRPRIGR